MRPGTKHIIAAYVLIPAYIGLSACSAGVEVPPKEPVTQAAKKNEKPVFKVRLLGPGDRGNYFVIQAKNFSPRGKCFEGKIGGVPGHGTLIYDNHERYNLYVYFLSRHSPKSDRDKIKAITAGKSVRVDLKISKCSKGFYNAQKHIASFAGTVEVAP